MRYLSYIALFACGCVYVCVLVLQLFIDHQYVRRHKPVRVVRSVNIRPIIFSDLIIIHTVHSRTVTTHTHTRTEPPRGLSRSFRDVVKLYNQTLRIAYCDLHELDVNRIEPACNGCPCHWRVSHQIGVLGLCKFSLCKYRAERSKRFVEV